MKEIILTKGKVALVSDEDFDRVNQYKWQAHYNKPRGVYVASGWVNGKMRLMHRVVMEVDDPKIKVDHIFHNTLDNRRECLRLATPAQNQANSLKRKGKSSKYKGVSWCKLNKKWKAKIYSHKTLHYLGLFKTEETAALQYNIKALELFGEFANLNIIDNVA